MKPPTSPHYAEESLRRYGTVAFGIECMRERIKFSQLVPGMIDGELWWEFVPCVYRAEVARIGDEIAARYRGLLATEGNLDGFLRAFNAEIWARIEPMSQ